VTRIGKVDVAEAIERVARLLSGDSAVEVLHSAPTYLASPDILAALGITDGPDAVPSRSCRARENARTVTLQPLPKVALIGMRAASGVADSLPSSRPGAYYWFAKVPGARALYFQVNASMNQDGTPSLSDVARDFYRRVDVEKPDAIVIDARNNNGGNVARNRELVEGIAERPPYLSSGRLIVIVGRRTFSAGLDLVVELKRVAKRFIVGEPPRGLPAKPGNRETFTLPNSLVIDYSQEIDSVVYRGHKRPLAVDVPAPPRFGDAIVGRDPALDAIGLAQRAR
jgi:hypothetical protein